MSIHVIYYCQYVQVIIIVFPCNMHAVFRLAAGLYVQIDPQEVIQDLH